MSEALRCFSCGLATPRQYYEETDEWNGPGLRCPQCQARGTEQAFEPEQDDDGDVAF